MMTGRRAQLKNTKNIGAFLPFLLLNFMSRDGGGLVEIINYKSAYTDNII